MKWKIIENLIVLEVSKNVSIKPSAQDIYNIEFENESKLEGYDIDCKPSEVLNQINFNRYSGFLNLKIQLNNNMTEIHGSLILELKLENFSINIKSINDLNDYLIIKDQWIVLNKQEIDHLIQSFHKAKINDIGPITIKQYLELMGTDTDIEIIEEVASEENIDTEEEVPYLEAKLRPFQKTGFNWLRKVYDEGLGCILADEMGLGKTIQIISLMCHIKHKKNDINLLVICPATLLDNWEQELKKFAPNLNSLIHWGTQRSFTPQIIDDNDVIITSYETSSNDQTLLNYRNWDLVILDEAQYIKNKNTGRSKDVKKIRKNIGMAVTGTPIENSLKDIWSIMDFTNPNYLPDFDEFEDRYVDEPLSASRLEPKISPLIMRRKTEDVAKDLPEKIEINKPVNMSSEEIDYYEKLKLEIYEEYGKNAGPVSFLRLRQLCCHPYLIEDAPNLESSKYNLFKDMIDELFLNKEKVIVFNTFQRMTDLILDDIKRTYNTHVNSIDGRTDRRERQKIVDQFNKEKEPGALIMNPRAGGVGLNITGASKVIHYNLEWNPAQEEQATRRAYRIGQKKNVYVYRLYYPRTVEEVILERLERKKLLSENAILPTPDDRDEIKDIYKVMKEFY